MFKEGASEGGAESMEGNTQDTSRWQKGGRGVHDTHIHIVPGTERKSEAHASLPLERKLFTHAGADI